MQQVNEQKQPKSATPLFVMIHFNDVYDIQQKKNIGGVCNFKAKLQQIKLQYKGANSQILLLFSGDAFSPSILSPIQYGEQMVNALNFLGIDAACYGNHEFDYEPDHTLKLAKKCNFPWLLGNIFYLETHQILGDGLPYLTKQLQNGLKVGIFGVGGQDWIYVLSEYYEDILEYQDSVNYSNRMAKYLKEQEKCDFVIALTHMRNGADIELAKNVESVDVILGGHDHIIMNKMVNHIPVFKSGCNFNNIGVIEVFKKSVEGATTEADVELDCNVQQVKQSFSGLRYDFTCQVQNVPSYQQEKHDQALRKYVDGVMLDYSKNDKLMGFTDCQLDIKFCNVRTKETSYGNFVADVIRLYNDCDFGLINSGSVRNDAIIPKGQLKYSMISNIIDQHIVVISIKGKIIVQMLEFSVSGLPDSFLGSFLLVSGLHFEYDLNKTPRIQKVYVGEGDFLQLDLQKEYHVATAAYMANGGDGFTMIKNCQRVVDQVHGIGLLELLLKFYQKMDIVQAKSENIDSNKNQQQSAKFKLLKKPSMKLVKIRTLRQGVRKDETGKNRVVICPKIEGRIKCVNTSQQ